MEDVFGTHNVYKTLMICDTDETCLNKLHTLVENEHSVSYIAEDHLQDERVSYLQRLRSFAMGTSRVLLMSYACWYLIVEAIESYAMDHNLLVMCNLDTQEKHIITSWIVDARSRGFATHNDYHILLQDESFSVPQE